jgi:hypothetical protein
VTLIQGFTQIVQTEIAHAGRPNSLLVAYRVLHLPSTRVVRDQVAQDSQEVRHRFARPASPLSMAPSEMRACVTS